MEVVPGVIRVNEVDVMADAANLKVWHVDLNSKYAEVLAYGGWEVLLHATERTLRTDPEHGQATVIRLPQLGDDWNLIADSGRYTCRIVAYRTTLPLEPVLSEPEDQHQ